jgi:hypothetical protein
MLINKLIDIFVAIRCFGFFSIARAVWYRFERKTACFKRKFPTTKWADLKLSDFVKADTNLDDLEKLIEPVRFFPFKNAASPKATLDGIVSVSRVSQSADDILNGTFTYFFKTQMQLGHDVNWHLNPFNGALWPSDVHWCELSNFSPQRGDVKLVWEISRFSWAYNLVRAYQLTNEQKYAERFWDLFERWLKANQPNMGINWGCGQECAIRVIAWCFALFGLLDAPSTTEKRISKMLLALAVTGQRIEKNIADAIRQKTNHAMTEAASLYTIGTLFPFLKEAGRWKRLGRKILEKEAIRQIYEDGTYLQQSMNYHRLMLQAYLWSLAIAEQNGDTFSEPLKARLMKATEFLYQMQDDSTGRLSNYGANDGALILPLNTCDYLDYRPVIQSCWYYLTNQRLYETGPWDEDLFWLFGSDTLKAEALKKSRVSSRFDIGSYYTLRSEKSWAMVRCHSYRDRVGHVDLLHLDLWADGINLLCDCGSYKYFAPDEPELEKYFKSIRAHNTIIIDDRSPLRLFSRFMYLPWPKAKLDKFKAGDDKQQFTGAHFAYDRRPWNVRHCRHATVDKDKWQIHDRLLGKGKHRLQLRWHLPVEARIISQDSRSVRIQLTVDWQLEVIGPDEITINILQADINGGWQSLYYNYKQPICTLTVSSYCHLPCEFKTIVLENKK